MLRLLATLVGFSIGFCLNIDIKLWSLNRRLNFFI